MVRYGEKSKMASWGSCCCGAALSLLKSVSEGRIFRCRSKAQTRSFVQTPRMGAMEMESAR